MADVFHRDNSNVVQPITADKCTINFGGILAAAIQVQITYSQGVQRRRTIGNKQAILFATYPVGQATIARMIAGNDGGSIFSAPGWDPCNPGQLSFNMAGCGNAGSGYNLVAKNCIVTQFSVTAEAEGLTVIDNVVVEFMDLSNS
jgi:hypothetical protein